MIARKHVLSALFALGLVVMVAVHAVALHQSVHHLAARVAIPTAATVSILGIAVLKHVGVFGAMWARGKLRKKS